MILNWFFTTVFNFMGSIINLLNSRSVMVGNIQVNIFSIFLGMILVTFFVKLLWRSPDK